MHNIALAPCSPFSVTPELLKESAKLARALWSKTAYSCCGNKRWRKILHRKTWKASAWVYGVGWLGRRWRMVCFMVFIFNDDELKLLEETGTGIAHCPVSNMKLASGVCRLPEMLDMGIKVGLAVDGKCIEWWLKFACRNSYCLSSA